MVAGVLASLAELELELGRSVEPQRLDAVRGPSSSLFSRAGCAPLGRPYFGGTNRRMTEIFTTAMDLTEAQELARLSTAALAPLQGSVPR
jgi:hypothetical protein